MSMKKYDIKRIVGEGIIYPIVDSYLTTTLHDAVIYTALIYSTNLLY